MPVAMSEKTHKENFAIRGLQFCGFIRTRRPSVTTPRVVVTSVKSPHSPAPAVTIRSLSKSTNDLLDNAPLVPPPPYLKHSSSSASSTSQSSLTAVSTSDEEGATVAAAAAAARRRSRRLSKPPPPNHDFTIPPPVPTSPLARTSSEPISPQQPSSSFSSTPASPTSPTTTATGGKKPFPSPRKNVTSKHTKSSGSIDSSGRSRPPISGVRSNSPQQSQSSDPNAPATAHTYHYKRARASSTADASRRTQDAALCLEALLNACESGAVDDMRHVIEQVALARKILIGDDDGIGLVNGNAKTGGGDGTAANSGGNGGTSSGLSSTWVGKLGASSSVTSLATLSNLIS